MWNKTHFNDTYCMCYMIARALHLECQIVSCWELGQAINLLGECMPLNTPTVVLSKIFCPFLSTKWKKKKDCPTSLSCSYTLNNFVNEKFNVYLFLNNAFTFKKRNPQPPFVSALISSALSLPQFNSFFLGHNFVNFSWHVY